MYLMGNMELLCKQCRGIRPHLRQGEVSWFFLGCGWNLGNILEIQRGWPFETHVCSATSGHLSSYDGHLRNIQEPYQGNTDASPCEAGD